MSVGGRVPGRADDGTDRARFVTVMRGYDQIEVDSTSVTRVGPCSGCAPARRERGRRRRAEQHAEAVDKEVRAARPSSTPGRAHPPRRASASARSGCCGSRSRRRPDPVRGIPGGRGDAAAPPRRGRTRPARGRAALIERENQFDEQVAQRTTTCSSASSGSPSRSRPPGTRPRPSRPSPAARPTSTAQRVHADAEEIVARARSEAGQIRDQAAQELSRLTGLQDSVRGGLARLATLLTQESAQNGLAPKAPARATGGEENR